MSAKPDPTVETKATDRRDRHAFVFGNAVMDETLLVDVLPKQGESVLGQAGRIGLGGKGANQAIALARTGVPTVLTAAIGADWYGREIGNALADEPVEQMLIHRPDLPSDRSVVVAQKGGDNIIVTTKACADSMTIADCARVLARSCPGDAVLLQGNFALDVTTQLARACRDRDLCLFMNPSPFNPAFSALVSLTDGLFVNETEALGLTGVTGKGAVMALLEEGARQVVLTLGAEGALLGTAREVIDVPACSSDVVDVTGAGDCFEGVAIGSALRRGTNIDETALRHASLAAAHTVRRVGAVQAFPNTEQMISILEADL